MQLTIKNATNGNGASRANGSPPAPVDGTVRRSVVLRALKVSVRDVREAVLQILSGAPPYIPRIQVNETQDAIDVTAMISGVDEDSMEVRFEGKFLWIQGTTTSVEERTRRKYHRLVKVSRTFERAIPMHCEVDRDKAVATLRKDILRVHVPKTEASHGALKAVPIAAESAPIS